MALSEFKPTIVFLIKFIAFYLGGNILYGFYVTWYYPFVDPATRWVTEQSAIILNLSGWQVSLLYSAGKPTATIVYQTRKIISVFEGCNGLNVLILYVSFLLAFGPLKRSMAWFLPSGIILIHLANLMRIVMLFGVALYFPDALYFVHKYLFTAIIFLVVLFLWMVWVKKFTSREA